MTSKNEVAVITGGASGLGKATALKLAEKGVSICLVDISDEAGTEAVKEVKAKGAEAIFVKADVSKADEVKNYVDKTVEIFGTITMFFNNAGISGPGTFFAEHTIEDIDKVIGINMAGALYGLKYVLEVMLKNGGGNIVNMASSAGVVGVPSVGAYSATKHGTVGITKTIAVEYAKDGIRANAVAPGTTETPMVKQYREDHPEIYAENMKGIPARRAGTPEEVAALVSFLLSDEVPYVNGVTIPIDGAFTAQ